MKITDISLQARDPNRVNVSVDGKYRFSLDITQVTSLGVKIGKEFSEAELEELETESSYGKLYARTLEYVMVRPRSIREVRDYLYRKTRVTRYKSRNGEMKERAGVSSELTERVMTRLVERGHVNDEAFSRWWVENRNQRKGSSMRKIAAELMSKGVERQIVETVMSETDRNDESELQKIIEKKARRYDSDEKLMQYLVRQGFSYDAVKDAIKRLDADS